MNEIEYLNKINKIRKQIENDPKRALTQLDEIYKIKPVRQQWFIAKAEAMVKLNDSYEEVFSVLSDKFGLETASEEIKMFFAIAGNMISDYVGKSRNLFYVALYSYLINPTDQTEACLQEFYVNLSHARDAYINNNSIENLIQLAYYYYITENQYMYSILCLLAKKTEESPNIELTDWVLELPNFGYLFEQLTDTPPHTFIVIESGGSDSLDCRIAANALSSLGNDVFLLTTPVQCPVDTAINMQDTLQISLENEEKSNDITVIHPLEIIKDGKSAGDNRDFIISYIYENLSINHLATVLCSGYLFDELDTRPAIQKQIQRLSLFRSDYLDRNMEFGWAGSYLSYISQIYGFDAQAEISKPAECDFSIVIPARNSAHCLRYTLQSCLSQRYKGKYEIVLSDNSTEGNTEVYDLYCELNDKRIKYYKTPRDLALPKSFEFAFLKARGNFIFSVGSDDAVLPWGLEVLSQVLKKLPDDELVKWDRGFYAWPEFNDGQQNQFTIPRNYDKNHIDIEKVKSNTLLANILNDPSYMYGLPMLYVNSGFRRSYFQTLLNKTGRLWDGICQDIYIGIVNISIHKDFHMIKFPITIAGMSDSSIGTISNKSVKDNNEVIQLHKKRYQMDNIGGYSQISIERLLPPYVTDRASLYRSILRVIGRGLLPLNLLGKIDWKKIFYFIAQQLSIDDIQLDMKLKWLRYSASLISKEVLKYVNEQIYAKLIEPTEIKRSSQNEAKLYSEGFNPQGGLILDASKFDVHNVYEATLLFEKITGI